MQDLPQGTVTFLFTDIEGSTRMWRDHAGAMPTAYERHDSILRSAVFAHGGVVYKTVGDAFQIAFPDAASAVSAALDAQRSLQSEAWPTLEPLKVRMALHTGAVDPTPGGDYRSPVLNRLGRLLGAAHGEQALVSQATMELARDHMPAGTSLLDLGDHRLKDLYRPERVWQLSHADLRSEFPPLRTLDTRPNNLPVQLTQFIGREDDVGAVVGLVRREDVRLVTLTGPGGIGKTRLSLQVGADLLDRFEHGVFFAGLDAIADPALVPSAIGQALGLRDTGEASMAELLTSLLRDRRMLLVLDNLEQVADAAPFISELLTEAPGIKVLGTSRTRLQIHGEHEYPVRPFALPDPERTRDVAAISQYESVRLFIERAEAARPSFRVTAANAPAISEICTRLDGLPLAIELAAARVKVLPPEAMLSRLSTRLPILTGGPKNLPARQQTLRGAIAWSYELLTPGHQALFRRVAVFSGGATLDAIQAVAADDGHTLDVLDVLDGIERLVDHSLLRQDEEAGEPRFGMYETIREFGLERLEEHGEADEAHRRHAAWVSELVSEFRLEMDADSLASWLDRVDAEQDNLRSALGWTLEHNPALTMRIVGFAGRFWQWRSHFREGHAWFDRVLAIESDVASMEDRARALRVSSIFMEAMGDFEAALEPLRVAEQLYTRLGDRAEAAMTRSVTGIVIAECNGYDAAIDSLMEAVDLAREAGSTSILAGCLNNVGAHALDVDDLPLARAVLTEALGLVAGTESGLYASTVVNTAADLFRHEGDIQRAESMYAQSLRDSWPGRLTGLINANLMGLAMAAVDSGRGERAARLAGAIAAYRRVGDHALEPDFSNFLSDYDRHLNRTMDTLGEEPFRVAWADGVATPLGDIVAELLAEERVTSG